MNETNINTKNNLTFFLDFTTGQKFEINGNPINSFRLTLYKFLKEKSMDIYKNKIKYCICNAKKIDFNKSLFENNIVQNCHVLCYIDDTNNINNDDNKIAVGFRLYGQITKAGCDYNGKSKLNQDNILIYLNVGNIDGFNLFGVLDGHGVNGYLVSKFCKYYFTRKMNEFAEKCKLDNISNPNQIYDKLRATDYRFLKNCFKNVDSEMSRENNFDCTLSGTTCNMVIQLNKFLICLNIGDSRSILIYDNDTNTNQGILPLSKDHTPDLPEEYDRIINSGGIAGKYIYDNKNGNVEDHIRIFKPGQNLPGIYLSRVLGDLMAKDCGVISEPQINVFKLNHNAKYLLIYSDGIWKYLKNEEIRDLGNKYYQKGDIGSFCSNLTRKAVYRWKQNGIIRDDISLVCIYF